MLKARALAHVILRKGGSGEERGEEREAFFRQKFKTFQIEEKKFGEEPSPPLLSRLLS